MSPASDQLLGPSKARSIMLDVKYKYDIVYTIVHLYSVAEEMENKLKKG